MEANGYGLGSKYMLQIMPPASTGQEFCRIDHDTTLVINFGEGSGEVTGVFAVFTPEHRISRSQNVWKAVSSVSFPGEGRVALELVPGEVGAR